MVIATESNIKTNTRRLTNLHFINEEPDNWQYSRFFNGHAKFTEKHNAINEQYVKCPYGDVGDILYVREMHYAYGRWVKDGKTKTGSQKYRFNDATLVFGQQYLYESKKPDIVLTGKKNKCGWYKRNSLFMPKAAARIFLEITEIYCERVQDISTDDIIAEGIKYRVLDGKPVFEIEENGAYMFMPAGWKINGSGIATTENDLLFAHWAETWCKINGRPSWDANQWVFVIRFKRIEKPEKF